MKRFSFLKTALLASAPLLLASCTVDEPNPEFSTDGSSSSSSNYYDSYRLTSVDGNAFEYNNVLTPTLPTKMYDTFSNEFGSSQRTWTLSYDSDSKLASIEVVYSEKLDYTYYGGISVTETWKNILQNESGAILSADIETYRYGEYYDDNYNPTKVDETVESKATFTYNANGELTSRTLGDRTFDYTWENGNLIAAQLEDGSRVEYTYSDYNNILNTARRWDPCQPFVNPLQHFGFFGIGPRQFMKSATVYNGLQSESARFVYEVEQSAFKQRTIFSGTSTSSSGTIYYNYERYYTL